MFEWLFNFDLFLMAVSCMPSKLLVPCFSLCLNHLVLGPTATPSTPTGDYAIALEQLASMTRDHNMSALQLYRGASHL